MSIQKNKFGDYTVYCDFCSDFYDTIESEMTAAWEEAKSAGWKQQYDPENYCYLHYCSDCWEKKNEG